MKLKKANPAGPFDFARKPLFQFIFLATTIFLYVPIIVLIIFSFNNSRRGGNVVWKGFTTKYYEKAFNNDGLIEAFVNSLTIAGISTLFSVLLGTLAAVTLWRFRFRFKPVFEGVVSLPIVVPEICLGVALAVFFSFAGFGVMREAIWPLNLTNIIIAHITFSFPFCAMVIRARLTSFNTEIEESAKDLGASEFQIFKDILIPHLKPGLIAAALLAFTLSLDDFVITFFTSGPNNVTFPVKVYSMVRFSVTPEVNAASTVLILMTIILTAAGLRLQNLGETK